MVIDDPWSDDQAICIQDASRVAVHLSDLGDTTAADGNVAVEAGYAGTVNNLSVSDDQVVWHCSSYAAGEHIAAPGPNCRRPLADKLFLDHEERRFFQRP
jgi:hypothetical protein